MAKSFLICFVVLVGCGDNLPDLPAEDGEACVESDGCTSGYCLTEFSDGTEVSGGICTHECAFGEVVDGCPQGQKCMRYSPTQQAYCTSYCDVLDSQCREEDGWYCGDFGFGIALCRPPLD